MLLLKSTYFKYGIDYMNYAVCNGDVCVNNRGKVVDLHV